MTDFEKGTESTPEDIIIFRDEKIRQTEKLFLEGAPSVISIGAVIPGNVKNSRASGIILKKALEITGNIIPTEEIKEISLAGGRVFLIPFYGDVIKVKEKLTGIEENHPIGRLMDLDVMTPSGSISRKDVGLSPRKCLICSKDAHICGRNRSHSKNELFEEINNIYVKIFSAGSGNI